MNELLLHTATWTLTDIVNERRQTVQSIWDDSTCKVLKIKLNSSRLLEIRIVVIRVGRVMTGVFHELMLITQVCYFIKIHQVVLEFVQLFNVYVLLQ